MSLFTFEDPVQLLAHLVDDRVAHGESLRSLAKTCGFKSSNYLQLITAGKRRLSVESATGIAKALKLKGAEQKYFLLLVRRDLASEKARPGIESKISQLKAEAQHVSISDQSLYDAWYHSVVYELSAFPDFSDDPAWLVKRLNNQVSAKEVQESIAFLANKGWLTKDPKTGAFIRKPIHFSGGNKNRNIKIQAMHKRFLEMAIHRLHEDVEEREYQAMTIAIPWSKFAVLKQMTRKFFDELEAELTTSDPSDQVIRIQCCAFKVTK